MLGLPLTVVLVSGQYGVQYPSTPSFPTLPGVAAPVQLPASSLRQVAEPPNGRRPTVPGVLQLL